MPSDFADSDLATLVGLIRHKKVSAVEAAKDCLQRIEAWQPRINAFIEVEHTEALRAAEELDRSLAQGNVKGPLHGVPLAHKDMFYRKGLVCSCGSKIRQNWVPDHDSTVMSRLTAAGSVTVGRLNMSEFAAHPTGDNTFFGAARNPWNTDYITGGSSSGSGAAVAARLVPAALGSDTGGSIRIPAAFNGVTGLMPTYGRISRYGAMPRGWSLDHIGPLARSAADCALLLEVIAGHDANDGSSAAREVPSYTSALTGGIRGLRVGVPRPREIRPPVERPREALRARMPGPALVSAQRWRRGDTLGTVSQVLPASARA